MLPHSTEAEQSVIGSMLMDKEAVLAASEIITKDDFYERQYGVMFEAMVELYQEGKPVDLVTVQDRLRPEGYTGGGGSPEFVLGLMNAVSTSANIRYYAQIVYEKSLLRRLIRLNEEIASTCYAGKDKVEDILEYTEKATFELLKRQGSGDFVPVRQIALDTLDRIEAAAKLKSSVTGIPTGFTDLDYRLSGLQRSDLVLVAARPSMGKTAFVLNIAQYACFKKNYSVAIFSLEMSKEQLMNRLFSMESRVASQSLRTGDLTDSEWSQLVESVGNDRKFPADYR